MPDEQKHASPVELHLFLFSLFLLPPLYPHHSVAIRVQVDNYFFLAVCESFVFSTSLNPLCFLVFVFLYLYFLFCISFTFISLFVYSFAFPLLWWPSVSVFSCVLYFSYSQFFISYFLISYLFFCNLFSMWCYITALVAQIIAKATQQARGAISQYQTRPLPGCLPWPPCSVCVQC